MTKKINSFFQRRKINMKTTNYEISKQLKEAGFEAETEFYWHAINNKIELHHVARAGLGDVKAYDLETILDALPEKIEFKEKEYCFWMQWSGSSDCYIMGYVRGNLRATELEVWREDENKNSESLADTAGRMWLLLKEKGIIC